MKGINLVTTSEPATSAVRGAVHPQRGRHRALLARCPARISPVSVSPAPSKDTPAEPSELILGLKGIWVRALLMVTLMTRVTQGTVLP